MERIVIEVVLLCLGIGMFFSILGCFIFKV